MSAEDEINRLYAENQRLRWRHPNIMPDWNDLPDAVRAKLCVIGESYSEHFEFGGDMALQFYNEIKAAMSMEPRP